jgi:hypothetical protein
MNMATLDSIQDFHLHLDKVCTSLEKLFLLVESDNDDLVQIAAPAMIHFRELLDAADAKGWSN